MTASVESNDRTVLVRETLTVTVSLIFLKINEFNRILSNANDASLKLKRTKRKKTFSFSPKLNFENI